MHSGQPRKNPKSVHGVTEPNFAHILKISISATVQQFGVFSVANRL